MGELPPPAHIREAARQQARKDAEDERRHQKVRDARASIKARREARLKPILDQEKARQIAEGQEPTSGEIEVPQQDKGMEGLDEINIEEFDTGTGVELDPEFASNLTETSQGVYEEMQPESKGLVASLYERVKSSDAVKNLVDRFSIWNDKRLANRTESKIAGLKDVLDDRMESMARVRDNLNTEKDRLVKIQEALQVLGRTMGQESLDTINDQIAQYQEAINGLNAEAQSLDSQIQEQENKLAIYQEGVERAKDSMTDRLQEKIDANNEEISGVLDEDVRFHTFNKECVNEIAKHEKIIENLNAILDTKPKPNKFLSGELKRQLESIENAQNNYRKRMADNTERRNNFRKRLVELEKANIELIAQVNKIKPPIELGDADIIEEADADLSPETATADQEIPLKYTIDTRTGAIHITDGEDMITITGDNATVIGPKKLLTMKTKQLPKDLLRQLPMDVLMAYKEVPQNTIDAIAESQKDEDVEVAPDIDNLDFVINPDTGSINFTFEGQNYNIRSSKFTVTEGSSVVTKSLDQLPENFVKYLAGVDLEAQGVNPRIIKSLTSAKVPEPEKTSTMETVAKQPEVQAPKAEAEKKIDGVKPQALIFTWNSNLSAEQRNNNMGLGLADLENPSQPISNITEARRILTKAITRKQGKKAAAYLDADAKKQLDGFFKNVSLFKKAS